MRFSQAIVSYLTDGALADLFQWWGVIFVIGLLFLPLTARLFHKFIDKGYLFAKVLGMVTVAYATWLVVSIGWLPFSRGTCMIAALSLALLWVAVSVKRGTLKTTRDAIRMMVVEEALFLAALILWGFVRALHPEIHGVEKFMDYGFMTAILNSPHLPPPDPWFSGFSINYYYFGHFTYAWLTSLSGIEPAVAYNLAIATIFAFSFSLAYSLAANMVLLRGDCSRILGHLAGLVSALLLTLGGNLFTATYGFLLPLLRHLGICLGKAPLYYPNATRFVGYFPPTSDRVITEFPSYSFVVADLHAHVMSIPLTLTLMGLAAAHIQEAFDEREFKGVGRKPWGSHLLVIWMLLMLVASSLTNAWTLATGTAIICAVSGVSGYLRTGKPGKGAIALVLAGVAAVIATATLTLPFRMHFRNFSQGFAFSDAHTPLWQMLVLWGYQLLVISWLMAALIMKRKRSDLEMTAPDYMVVTFALCALLLIAIPEFVYVKDIYAYTERRANTVFKFSYEAFILLTAPVGYAAVLIAGKLTSAARRLTVAAILAMLLYLPLTFIWVAFLQGCALPEKSRQLGLDGLEYMRQTKPGDFYAAKWLKENAPVDAIILEAEGESYSDYGRISMMTGRQTVLGWFVHEWLWRNDKGVVEKRRSDVRDIYQAKEKGEAIRLLKSYHVRYLIIGDLEAKRYPAISRSMLTGLGRVVFSSDGTVVIDIGNKGSAQRSW